MEVGKSKANERLVEMEVAGALAVSEDSGSEHIWDVALKTDHFLSLSDIYQ